MAATTVSRRTRATSAAMPARSRATGRRSTGLSMPPSGQRPLPNVLNQRTETQGSSVADRYFEFDTATGFLRGSFVYDPAKDVALVDCRYDDGDGNANRELTKTVASSSPPARTYCSSTHPTFPNVGTDGDMFGKALTFQDGQALTARWVNGTTSTATYFLRDVTRDAATGWVTVLARRRRPRDVLCLRRPGPAHADHAACRRRAEDARLLRRADQHHGVPGERPAGLPRREHEPERRDLGALRLRRPRAHRARTTAPARRLRQQAVHPVRWRRPRVLPVGVGGERRRRIGQRRRRDDLRLRRRQRRDRAPIGRPGHLPALLGPVRPPAADRRRQAFLARRGRPVGRRHALQRHVGTGHGLLRERHVLGPRGADVLIGRAESGPRHAPRRLRPRDERQRAHR